MFQNCLSSFDPTSCPRWPSLWPFPRLRSRKWSFKKNSQKTHKQQINKTFSIFLLLYGCCIIFAYIVQKNLSLLCCSVSKNLTFESMMFWCISNMFFCLACSGIHTKHQWFPKKIIKIFQKTKSVSQKNYKIYKNQKNYKNEKRNKKTLKPHKIQKNYKIDKNH